MSGRTVPIVTMEQGTVVPSQDFRIKVVPDDGDRILIIEIDGKKRTLHLPEADAKTLAGLLTDEK